MSSSRTVPTPITGRRGDSNFSNAFCLSSESHLLQHPIQMCHREPYDVVVIATDSRHIPSEGSLNAISALNPQRIVILIPPL